MPGSKDYKTMRDLHYQSDTFAGKFLEEELRDFASRFNALEDREFKFAPEESYIEHMHRYHGGVPGLSAVRLPGGEQSVFRFLNWLPEGSGNPLGRYSVPHVHSVLAHRLCEDDQSILIPFLELDSADLLCFDLRTTPTHDVVLWIESESMEDRPETVFVAHSFDNLLSLFDQPSD